jgi:hypothetical protein
MMSNRERKQLVRSLSKRPARRRPMVALVHYLLSVGILWVALELSRSIEITAWVAVPIAAALLQFVGWALRPLLIRIAVMLGWLGAIVLALFFNATVMYVTLKLTPGITDTGFGSVYLVAWIYVAVLSAVLWLTSADSDEIFLTYLTRRSIRKEFADALTPTELTTLRAGGELVPGVVFVQLDGLPAPVLEWGVKSGNFPNLARWIRSGEMAWSEWTVRIPSTTPASQAGLLHGDNFDIPAFRWFEKDTGKLVVANHPPDAAEIERRVSNGRGLLADNGVSISNLFSGDAATSVLVMSQLRASARAKGAASSYTSFFTHPAGFARALVTTVAEMVKELYQARTQRRRGIEPRISRRGSFVFLRAVTNVLLRDLNTALVAQAMLRGSRSIYVDYVDYDEIAHHAGVVRPESLRALEGIDEVLGHIARLSDLCPRRYHVVCVSDHGQSQGATFRQRYGKALEEVITDYLGSGTAAAATGSVEDWGPVNAFLSELQTHRSVSGGLTRRMLSRRTADGVVALGPGDREHRDADSSSDASAVVVVGSGNLGGVWFTAEPERLTAEEIELAWPGLISMLSRHPGVAFVVVATDRDGPVAIGRSGLQRLLTGEVEGVDPLAAFGPEAREDFLRASRFPHAPDIYVNSLYDERIDEVAAFEELVGCHGGLGGWQTRAVLIHPVELPIASELLTSRGELIGSETVHRQLVRWLEQLGHRDDLARPSAVDPSSAAGTAAATPAAALADTAADTPAVAAAADTPAAAAAADQPAQVESPNAPRGRFRQAAPPESGWR